MKMLEGQVHKKQNLVVLFIVEVPDIVINDIHLIQLNPIRILIIEIDIDQIINQNQNIVDHIHVHLKVKMNEDENLNNMKKLMKQIIVVIGDIHQLVQVIVQQLVVRVEIENDEFRSKNMNQNQQVQLLCITFH
jgi:hypothetical protein